MLLVSARERVSEREIARVARVPEVAVGVEGSVGGRCRVGRL